MLPPIFVSLSLYLSLFFLFINKAFNKVFFFFSVLFLCSTLCLYNLHSLSLPYSFSVSFFFSPSFPFYLFSIYIFSLSISFHICSISNYGRFRDFDENIEQHRIYRLESLYILMQNIKNLLIASSLCLTLFVLIFLLTYPLFFVRFLNSLESR